MNNPTWATFYEANGVLAYEFTPEHYDSYFVVSDIATTNAMHFSISFTPTRMGDVSVNVAARYDTSSDRLASYTHDMQLYCGPEETGDVLDISDDGTLTVMIRETSADFRMSKGIILQLPKEYVPAVRLTIDKARKVAKARADATLCDTIKPAAIPPGLSADEYEAGEWRHDFAGMVFKDAMQAAGSTGVVVDAWRAWKASAHQAPRGWDQVEA